MLNSDVQELKRERPEGVIMQDGACRFCGQMRRIDTMVQWEQDDINEAVTEICDCFDAQLYAGQKRKKERTYRIIERKFRVDGKCVFENPEVMEVLRRGADMITEGFLKSLTLDDGKKTKAKLSETSKGGIKVEKIVTEKESEEE